MKNLSILCVAVVAMLVVGLTANTADAQCFSRSRAVVVNSGFHGGVAFVQPQAVVVPQSTAFFSGGNVAFINTPQAFVGHRAFVNVNPVVQQVNVRRGLFGRVRRVQVNNFAAPAAVRVNVGRTRVFVR